ncbi:uncharacterized protein BKA55DRAFT_600537 [Fusarium redolens]|uniref:non-specific serine/threonine protein kinase n=1 Tax=Fusarium redolens TaxID=48865 RepID=A0A9P9FVB8_FUSRE|nr:uncharacterized protein BKA55DRAFT_600537 [Fusarium redolens]KAH7202718.1 hypothetical protein BKA55DRAFT_600537 [Fusarium redolens]
MPPPNRIGTTNCSDFVDLEDKHKFNKVAEDLELYTWGSYYPTYIGDILANRYCIDYKLGHSGFSVVWMAYNMHSKRDIALKIMVLGDSGERECYMQDEIKNSVSDTSCLLVYQDTFLITGSCGHLNSANVMMILLSIQQKPGELVMPIALRKELVMQRGQLPAIYCASERVHGVDLSFISDMWSYMCLFVELYGDSCDLEWYNQHQKPSPHLGLEDKILRLRPDINTTELRLILDILRWGFLYLPEHRLTAVQLLDSVLFKDLMAIYRL